MRIPVALQERFLFKRIGALMASQTFSAENSVAILFTQLLRKEFGARSQYEIGLAINCLANIATPDLARDLLPDVATMLTKCVIVRGVCT